jgi:hypothetical protein
LAHLAANSAEVFSLSPNAMRVLRGAAVVVLGTILLLLTKHAQAATLSAPSTSNTSAVADTVWTSTPQPLRTTTVPGHLPKSLTWFNLENAEIAPGHAEDVLRATLGSFPKDADAVLLHVMTWNPVPAKDGKSAAGPAKQHWTLLDSHLRAMPMSAMRTLKHIALVYVTYRRPAQMPVVYTLRQEGSSSSGTATQQIADTSKTDAGSSLAWGSHTFAVAPGATRVSFVWGKQAQPAAPLVAATNAFRTPGYQPLPAHVHMTFDFSQLRHKPKDGDASVFSVVPAWMLSAARAAKLSGDYSVSNTQGLLLAGNGLAYQPVYTLWATAGFGPSNARVYGGLVTNTALVLHDSVASMNWGTTYGAGAGVHFEWAGKN